jgi:dipeptidyl aminopeptidase/acylaminoacyl peptidase
VGRRHTAFAQLAIVDALVDSRAGRVDEPDRWRVLGAGWDGDVNTPLRWSPDGTAVLFAAESRGRRHLWRHALDADAPSVLHEGGWVQDFGVAAGTLAIVADSALHPPRVFARHDGGAPRRIESFNDAALAGVRLGAVREVTLKGARGDTVQMWLVHPPGFDPKKKHPVMQVIHGGPFTASGDSWSWRWNVHVLASRGHVVAAVNFHGSSGFGAAFRDAITGRQGELELQDIESGTDWLLAQRWADRKRLVAAGASYGGFLVAWMNGHVPAGRYRAYVCHAGVFDRVATFSADSFNERPKDLGANFWDDLPRVLAQSPMAFAAQMNTPTLVVHGAQDFRVPDTNGLAYYNTLKARGVEARLLWFADENHWVCKPRNSVQWYGEVLAWLQR